MRKLVEFFLDRPLLVNLIVIAVIGLGIKAAFDAQKEGFPEISMNQVIIRTIYPGASAKDVEINVTLSIEDALDEVEGIKEVVSVSEEGISNITVQADDNASDSEFQQLYTDIDNALSKVDDLPIDIDGRPSISKFTSKDIPVMEIAFFGPYKKLKNYVPFVESAIKKVDGVSAVDMVGLPDDEIQILVDPAKARSNMVGLRTIAQSISKRNLEGSGGTLESFIGEKKIVSYNKFKDYREVLDTNVVRSAEGYGVKLGKIADVEIEPKDMKLLVRNNGERGVMVTIKKKSNSDILKTCDRIEKVLTKTPPPEGVRTKVLVDQSNFTSDRLNLLKGNSIMGFILVAIILFVIFNIKTAFWTAFGIPFSLMGMCIYMKNAGVSINLISLGGFVIVLGMLVDDAIVIAEEISRNKEKGLPPKEAAIEAVSKMWMPVLGACLTTMIAFSPILSMGGSAGKFVWILPIMVIVALCISLFESFFILPAHLCHGKTKEHAPKAFVIKTERLYKRLLQKILRFKYPVLLGMVLLLLLSLVVMNKFVTKTPFPQDAAEAFDIKITMPRGTNLESTRKKIIEFEKIISTLPEQELVGFTSRIGTQSGLTTIDRGTQHNIAIIFVYLTQYSKRDRTAEIIMDLMRKKIQQNSTIKDISYSVNLKRIGPPMGKPFEVRISSNDDEVREAKEKEIKAFLKSLDGVSDVENNESDGKEEWNLAIKHDTLARTGLTVEDVLSTIRIAFDGQIVTDMVTSGKKNAASSEIFDMPAINKKIDFRLRLNRKGRADTAFINSLPIMNRHGNLINLKEIVELKPQTGKAEIHHVDGKKTVTLFGNVDIEKIAPVEIMAKVKEKFPSSLKAEISFSGQPVESGKIFADLGSAAILAFLGVYLLISLIFNSFAKPFIIMLTIPFGLVGIAFSLVTHGQPLSVFSGVAMVGLMGVVVNDSIVMVHTIGHMAEDKPISKDLIVEGAVTRLRPILLTTFTTVIGILPTAYGIGGYDPFLSQMCVSLAYGLLFGTMFILFLVPIYYAVGLDMRMVIGKLRESMSG
ncbi:MAG: efflux RND transporter permease subunit [bacterium]|nr:efflux RND transporter permease subunit [bacterium]